MNVFKCKEARLIKWGKNGKKTQTIHAFNCIEAHLIQKYEIITI